MNFLWIPVTIAAAFFQNLRSSLQRHLKGKLSDMGATYVRFAFAWPFAVIWLALLVLGFLRFGLPPEDRIQLQDLPTYNLAIFLGYLFISFTVASYFTLRMLIPVMRWQRRDMLLGDRDPAETDQTELGLLMAGITEKPDRPLIDAVDAKLDAKEAREAGHG